MFEKYIALENELIAEYRVQIDSNSKCWGRTHAHCDRTRRICKYKKVNSIQSAFTLAHEIGHIMTKTSNMRRCESEYYATVWALQTLDMCGYKVPQSIIDRYQDYINMELDRGLRRGGKNYPSREDLDLSKAEDVKLKTKRVPTRSEWTKIQSEPIKKRMRRIM